MQDKYATFPLELGHNWGSEHDPDTDECSPSSFDGGKYIMYTYSVSGYDPNNKVLLVLFEEYLTHKCQICR